jgi:acetyl esterase/lipase
MRPHENEQACLPSNRPGGLGFWLLSIALSCGLGPWCHAAETPVGQMRVYKKVDNRELRLYIVNPAAWQPTDQRPALVLFHGGGWTGGSPAQFNDQATYLAQRGLVCIQVEYRLVKDVPGPPIHCVQDAKSAMRWVRSHAAELGVDPDRIGAGGGSAGGHLAAFVGLVQGQDDPQDDLQVSPKANSLVLFNPVFDNGPDGGWGQQRVGDRTKDFSPAHNISADDPPAIVFLGRNDALIAVSVVERFQANMTGANVRCETRYYEGQSHGFFNKDPWKAITLAEADRFLTSLGWLKGEPTLQVPELPKPAETPAAANKKKRKIGGS